MDAVSSPSAPGLESPHVVWAGGSSGLKFCLIVFSPWRNFLKLQIPRPTAEDCGLG